MKILMVNIPNYLKTNCEYIGLQLGAEYIFINSITDSLALIESKNDTDIIIVYIEKFETKLSEFYKKIHSKELCFLGITRIENENIDYDNFKMNFSKVKIVDHLSSKEEMLNTIKELIGFISSSEKFNYIQIPIEKQLGINFAFCDIYISLSPVKYVKFLNAGDIYNDQDIQNYILKGVSNLYIKSEDFDKYTKSYSEHLNSVIKNTSQENTLLIQIQGIEHIYTTALHMGINEDVIKDVNLIATTCLDKIKRRDNDIFKLLDESSKGSNYLYSHGLLISYVASSILSCLGWSSESSLEKIIIASLLHDLTLAGEEFSDFDEEKISKMNWKIIKKVKNHPIDVAEIIAKGKDFPPDIDKIILSHHERPDGTGYPKGLNAQLIAPMASVFIIAEDFVHLASGKQLTPELKEEIIDNFSLKYNKGNFKLPLEGFKKFIES